MADYKIKIDLEANDRGTAAILANITRQVRQLNQLSARLGGGVGGRRGGTAAPNPNRALREQERLARAAAREAERAAKATDRAEQQRLANRNRLILGNFRLQQQMEAQGLREIKAREAAERRLERDRQRFARQEQRRRASAGAALMRGGAGLSRFASFAQAQFSDVIATAVTFEQEMANVRSVTSDARNIAVDPSAKKNFEALTGLARDLGEKTEFTATQAAEGLKYLGIAGFTTQQQLDALPPILDLATAAQHDFGKSADYVSDIMGGFGIAATNTRDVTDQLTYAFTRQNTTLALISRSLFKVGPLAREAFQPKNAKETAEGLAEMAGAAAFLGSKGIKGAEAGTVLRNTLLGITGKTTKDAGLALRTLGLSSKQLKALLATKGAKGFGDVLKVIGERMDNLSGPKRLRIMEALFGKRTAAAATALMGGFRTGELQTFIDNVANAQGETENVAKTMRSTTLAGFKAFQSAVESLKIELGNQLLPVLKEYTPQLIKMVQAGIAWVRENGAMVVQGGKLLALFIGLQRVTSVTVTAIGTLNSLWGGMGLAMSQSTAGMSQASAGLVALRTPLSAVSGVAGAASLAFGAFGAAVAGFAAGTAIDQIFGISDALAGLNRNVNALRGAPDLEVLGAMSPEELSDRKKLVAQIEKDQATVDSGQTHEIDPVTKQAVSIVDRIKSNQAKVAALETGAKARKEKKAADAAAEGKETAVANALSGAAGAFAGLSYNPMTAAAIISGRRERTKSEGSRIREVQKVEVKLTVDQENRLVRATAGGESYDMAEGY